MQDSSWVYTGAEADGLYDISQSSTFANLTTDFNANVGDAVGYWADETVNVGGIDIGGMIGMVEYIYISRFPQSAVSTPLDSKGFLMRRLLTISTVALDTLRAVLWASPLHQAQILLLAVSLMKFLPIAASR